MHRFKAGVPVMAFVVALGATGAAFAMENDTGNSHEIAAALAAKTTLAQAVAVAEQGAEGRGLEIGLEDRNGTYAYKVTVVTKDDNVSDVFVDPATGKILRTEAEGLVSRIFDREDRVEAAKLKEATATLSGAITAAEQQAGGKAIEAGYEDENGRTFFEVTVAKDNAVRDVRVDGATGKVVKIEAAGNGENHEGEQDED